jgi:hypothetical protein
VSAAVASSSVGAGAGQGSFPALGALSTAPQQNSAVSCALHSLLRVLLRSFMRVPQLRPPHAGIEDFPNVKKDDCCATSCCCIQKSLGLREWQVLQYLCLRLTITGDVANIV